MELNLVQTKSVHPEMDYLSSSMNSIRKGISRWQIDLRQQLRNKRKLKKGMKMRKKIYARSVSWMRIIWSTQPAITWLCAVSVHFQFQRRTGSALFVGRKDSSSWCINDFGTCNDNILSIIDDQKRTDQAKIT